MVRYTRYQNTAGIKSGAARNGLGFVRGFTRLSTEAVTRRGKEGSSEQCLNAMFPAKASRSSRIRPIWRVARFKIYRPATTNPVSRQRTLFLKQRTPFFVRFIGGQQRTPLYNSERRFTTTNSFQTCRVSIYNDVYSLPRRK